MKLPDKDWRYNEWVRYVIENRKEVFGSKKGKWLKVYYVHSNTTAKELLLSEERPRKQGHFTVIKMKYTQSVSGRSKTREYWMHEKEPGLLMFFTASTKEGYEKTLRHKIRNRLGLHEMWIKPTSFERIQKYLVQQKKCGIAKFLADRKPTDPLPQQVKEEAARHIQYRTDNYDDGVIRLDEMKYTYGITPHSIEFVYNGNKIQITDEGLFDMKTVSKESFELMDEVIERIREEEKNMRLTAQGLHFVPEVPHIGSKEGILETGRIMLERELDAEMAVHITKHFKKFVFVDTKIKAGSLVFSSTVVDKQKGSVFALSATEKNILLVPKYKPTFETFLVFYQDVVELIDANAKLGKLSEIIES
jgi:hypothetical protein